MKSRKVIILGKTPPPYMGTSIWFETLHNSPLEKHFTIYWFDVNVHRDLRKMGKFSFLSIFRNLGLYINFINVLCNFRPDIVLIPISQSTLGFIKDSLFIRIARGKSKTLLMLHGSNIRNWLANSSSLMNQYYSKSLKNTYGIIVLGNKLKSIFLDLYPDSRIFVVPNGLNLPNNTKLKREHTTITLGYIGSLIQAKGIYNLLQTVEILKRDQYDFELLLAGKWLDNSFKKKCELFIDKNSLPVRALGQCIGQAKKDFFSKTDIFAFTPNKPEGHPLVIIEAMAAGLPIISTDQGAITESVIDKLNGFIVKPNSPEEIAEKIRYLIDNPEERTRMGKESRRLYEQNFTEEKMVERLTNVFNQVLNSKS